MGTTSTAFAATQARYHSSHDGQEAVGRLRDALEQYRVKNYSREIPSRFKREIAAASTTTASLSSSSSLAIATGGAERRASDRTIAVEGIETMLRNIGVFGNDVTREDVETVVADAAGGGGNNKAERIRADKIILELL